MDEIQTKLYEMYSKVNDNFQAFICSKCYTKQQLLDHIKNKTEVYEQLKEIESHAIKSLAKKNKV